MCNCTESILLPRLVRCRKLRNSPGLSFHDAFFNERDGSFPSSAIQNIHRDPATAANYSPCLMWALPQGVTFPRQHRESSCLNVLPFAEAALGSLKAPHTDRAPAVPPPPQRRDSDRYCQLCTAWFNNPLMAQQHYDGKKHKKNAARADLLEQLGKTLDLGELRGETPARAPAPHGIPRPVVQGAPGAASPGSQFCKPSPAPEYQPAALGAPGAGAAS